MLKVSLLIAAVIATFALAAQKAVVLENSKENNALFDESNPLSFVSLVKTNSRYLGYMDIAGMSPELLQELSAEEKSQITDFVGNPGTTPLIDDDPESPNFGNHLIVTNEESGIQSFVYAAPDTIKTILSNIDRIVLEYSVGEGNIWDRIDKVAYMKQYDGVYHRVLSLNASDLLSFDGFSRFVEMNESLSNEILGANPNSLWNAMRREALAQQDAYEGEDFNRYSYDLKNRYFPGEAILYGFFDWSNGPANLDTWESDREAYFARENESQYMAQFPFGVSLGSGIYRDTTGKGNLLNMFDEVHQSQETKVKSKNDRPLKEVYFWLDYSDVKIYISESYYATGEATVSAIDAIYFTKEVNGVDEVVSVVPMSDAVALYLKDYESTTIQSLPFYQLLEKRVQDNNYHFILVD